MKKWSFVFFSLLLVLLLMWLLSSCATVFSGSTQKVSFDSNPAGAEVYVDGASTNKTTLAEYSSSANPII